MSLSGTFDVFSLPEVLRMLASAGKSGTLTVETGGRAALVELYEGECCGAGHDGDGEPLVANHTAAALHGRLLDVAFESRGQRDGAFRFAGDEHPRPRPAACAPVEPVLEELEQLEREWQDIAAVIPSTDAIPVLAPQLGDDEIVITKFEWALLACLDGSASVRELPGRSGGTLVGVCRALASLVRRGAIDVAPAPKPVPAPAVSAPSKQALAETVAAVEEMVAAAPRPAAEEEPVAIETIVDAEEPADPEPVLEPVADEEPSSDTPPVEGDRGAMLRLFSALRE